MKVFKFTLSGKTAFFKKPEMNAHLYFTYGHIHKVALLGAFGAMLGLKGYNHQKIEQTVFPEFYEQLKDLQIAIVPLNEKGYINKKVQQFNNSTAFASYEQGGNLIVKEQWLEQPKWDVYILLNDQQYAMKIAESIINKKAVYIPYLGKNDHFAKFSDAVYLDANKLEAEVERKIASLCMLTAVEHVDEKDETELYGIINESIWRYEEMFPVGLTEETNQYILSNLILTNNLLRIKDNSSFYEINNQTSTIVQFF